jgi:hypothetical protein
VVTNDSAEIYNPATGRWTPTAPLNAPRFDHTATTLPDGQVLVAGGTSSGYGSGFATAELYDPAANRWTPTEPLSQGFARHRAVPLPNGQVLLMGGDGTPRGAQRAAERYTDDPPPAQCFAETGQCLRGRFLEYWRQRGGLAINGYPISGPIIETLEDGLDYKVQYFERARFEYHPGNVGTPYDVLLGQFGRRLYPVDTRYPTQGAAPPRRGASYFPETGHNLGGRFREYWEANGGLAQFGFPLSEEFVERLEDGREYTVQYFERARLELHPENAPPYDVLLGQFGRRILAESGMLAGPFGQLYRTNEGVRNRLGSPLAPAASVPGATQEFQRGRMFYRGDTRQIYALCFESVIYNGKWSVFPDTWAEGQPEGGGPAPDSGYFLPRRGFGKVWRENPDLQRCLGYASAAEETALTLLVQPFARGLMLFEGIGPAGYGRTYVLSTDGEYAYFP